MNAREKFELLFGALWGHEESTPMLADVVAADNYGRELLLGADRQERRHILTPISEEFAFAPVKGAVTSLDEWRSPADGKRYLDASCSSQALAGVFSRFADNIVDRLKSGAATSDAIVTAMKEWKQLFRAAPELSEDTARGLFGELYVLSLLARRNPHAALDVWTGPEGSPHDFMAEGQHLEVKTTRREGLAVEITSLDQLDTVGDVPLALLRLRTLTQPDGRNIGDMVDALVELGCFREELDEKLALVGYLREHDPDQHRFVIVEEPVVWRVEETFPGLRSSDIPEERRDAVTRVKYTLDLVGAPARLEPSDVDAMLDGLVSA